MGMFFGLCAVVALASMFWFVPGDDEDSDDWWVLSDD